MGLRLEVPLWPTWLKKLNKDIVEQREPPDIQHQRVAEVVKRAPAEAGTGIDQWRAHTWSRLPKEGIAALTSLLGSCQ